eukprot:TRINITY_DN4721_c0_g1_i4.p1 TRINITY_DN4721_c0_g1~~TRINITY_DN4721_c0_g1_i4.p1  ORF type:complete len:161 (-),score=12.64 TRINITY_DN4721_c0_g1_i4:334-816(-)
MKPEGMDENNRSNRYWSTYILAWKRFKASTEDVEVVREQILNKQQNCNEGIDEDPILELGEETYLSMMKRKKKAERKRKKKKQGEKRGLPHCHRCPDTIHSEIGQRGMFVIKAELGSCFGGFCSRQQRMVDNRIQIRRALIPGFATTTLESLHRGRRFHV